VTVDTVSGITECMKAALYDEYGESEVVRIGEAPEPTPKPGEVLVRVHATTVSSGDWRMRSKEIPKGFAILAPLIFGRRPKQRILGTELAGVIEALGYGVTTWKVGDAVFAFPGGKMGAHAEYVCLPESGNIARKPGCARNR
jgi:NADPH:quinone reductase-like Zn-dependent oxidoreductase